MDFSGVFGLKFIVPWDSKPLMAWRKEGEGEKCYLGLARRVFFMLTESFDTTFN